MLAADLPCLDEATPADFHAMCGIAGIWRKDGADAQPALLGPMLDAIVHRGPDDIGTWSNGRVALGHTRLTILDLTDRGHQPLVTEDGQGVLVYNGEVYNYPTLRAELEEEGIAFHSTGDSEVVLKALHHWGPEKSIPRFDGMFAFAYLDRRGGNETFWLARDRIGIKPLVVAELGDELVFASEVKSLLAHPRVPRVPDDRALTWLLFQTRIEPHRTAFAGIRGLRPGTWWRIDERGKREHTYWRPADAVDVDRLVEAQGRDPGSFLDELRATFTGSVRMHLASDVPLATMCSGGVDSSLITAYAKDDHPDLHAYVSEVDWSESEGDQAVRVGEHLGVPVHRVHLGKEQFLRMWPEIVWFGDRAPSGPSDPALLNVTRRCRADGVKVLLTGEGADELLGGYDWQRRTWQIWNRIAWPRRCFRAAGRSRQDRRRLKLGPLRSMLGRDDILARRHLIFALDAEAETRPFRTLERLQRVKPEADRAYLAQCIEDLDRHLASILHRHDRIGMASSMEMRVPFLENAMFDFALHLPRRAKYQRGQTKWLLKSLAEERLPHDVVHARKKGFPMPTSYYGGCEEIVRDGALAEHMGWSRETLDVLLPLAREEPRLAWCIASLELWMRIFFRNESPDELGEMLVQRLS